MLRIAGLAFAGTVALFGGAVAVVPQPATAQTTTLTMSSWVSPSHLLTKDVLAVWGEQVEKATNGRVKLHMLPKHPSAAPGTFDAVKDGLVDVSADLQCRFEQQLIITGALVREFCGNRCELTAYGGHR